MSNSDVQLLSDGQVSFPIDHTSSIRPRYISTCRLDGRDYVVMVNREGQPSLQFFDLSTQKESHRIRLYADGPNGVGSPLAAHVYSKDSIFIVSGYDNFVSLINWNGIVKRRYFPSESNIQQGNLWLWESDQIFFYGRKMYMGILPSSYGKRSMHEDFVGLYLNIDTGRFSYFKKYNKDFIDEFYGSISNFSFQRNGVDNSVIYSYPASDIIDVYNARSNTSYSKKLNGSKYFSYFTVVDENIQEDYRHSLSKFKYGNIIYDQYRECYYRFVEHPFTQTEISEKFYTTYFSHRFSIIVYDNSFYKIGETMFPDDRFSSKYYFIAPDGLYISNSHPDNPNLQEDALVFTRFVPDL